ncbi:hypothetical protein chiPu_0019572 [Chiloscyllium punctatum]|uniref:Uncharacterized protein n=1 Tax=Chiloscyllium punctatum TaxID=137246 RepID=A0A401RSH9_CHIPU|nr:hypothetical protein [Chiloscyllium punctatum]
MAADKQVLISTEDLTCSICLSLFVEPVQLECEHNFCKSCIQTYWENQGQVVSCPECRAVSQQKSYKKARVLANLCEKARQLELEPGLQQEGGSRCLEHDEKLKLICQDDQALICVICRDSPAHSGHSFLPVADAVRKYKVQLQSPLHSFEERKNRKIKLKHQQEEKISELDELTQSLEQHISEQFAKIQQYLEDKKACLIRELQMQREDAFKLMDLNLAEINKELKSLEEDVSKLQAVIHQEDNITFLKEMKRLPERYLGSEKSESEEETNDDVDEDDNKNEGDSDDDKNDDASDDDHDDDETNDDTDDDENERSDEASDHESDENDEDVVEFSDLILGKFRGPLQYAIWKEMKGILSPVPAPLLFDPDAAHSQLTVSDDQTSVELDNMKVVNESEYLYVLGSEGFTFGIHYWEVAVADISDWLIGVATESATEEEMVDVFPEHGYWTLLLRDGDEYYADETLKLDVKPRIIGIYLDYEGGQLSFYNADDMSHLFTYTDTFTEKLFPCFALVCNDDVENNEPLRFNHLLI